MKKILVTLDLKHKHTPLVDKTTDIAVAMESEVLLVHVVTDDNAGSNEAVINIMQSIAAGMVASGVDTSIEILTGKPGEAVVAKGNEIEADLLVVGTHGNSSVFDTLAGSAGQDIIQHAGRPVLLVPVPKD